MYKSYFKIAWRNLLKQKTLTGINIMGLSVGIFGFSLFLIYAVHEFSYDQFHVNAKNIYRVHQWSTDPANNDREGAVYLPMPLGPAMKRDIPGVKNFVRIKEAWNESFVRIRSEIVPIPVSFVDPSLFIVFSFKLKSATKTSVFNDLHEIVLSEKTAIKLFGKTDPIGKVIEIRMQDEYEPFTIAGVAENPPSNSSIDFEILASFEYFATTRNGKNSIGNWNRPAYLTYVELEPGQRIESQTLQSFYNQYHPGEATGANMSYALQPLYNMHTDTKIKGGRIGNIDPDNIWILLGIAGCILLIACINFTTLAIGRSAGRTKEVGIRKVLGSEKKSLVVQFLAEALILSIFSTFLAVLFIFLLYPYFNQLAGKELDLSIKQAPVWFGYISLIAIGVGLLAGTYPALILSGFKPIQAFQQKIKLGGANLFTRSLVTFQFILSIGLIASMSVMVTQINFMMDNKSGIDKSQIMVVNGDKVNAKLYPLFKQAARQFSAIEGMSGAGLTLGAGAGLGRIEFKYENQPKEVYTYFVDDDFIPLMNMQLLAGRNFNPPGIAQNENSVIINETMVMTFGWTMENAIGQELKGYFENKEMKPPVVTGVIKDFHFRSLKEEIKPQLFHRFAGFEPNKYFVRIHAEDPSKTISQLEWIWKKLIPDIPFRYSFLDEDFHRFYQEETRWRNIISGAGGLAIFLACLGMFGLSVLATNNRRKEIAIRKVLGASIAGLTQLLSKEFLNLVILAIFIAIPLSWWAMRVWLQSYAYRIAISWWMFVVIAILVLGITMFTVSLRVIKLALANPLANLRRD